MNEPESQNEASAGQSALNVGLGIAARLRASIPEGDGHNGEYARTLADAAVEIDRLHTLAINAYDAWTEDKDSRVGKLLLAMLDDTFCAE